jgi:hypothetical protein
MDFSNHKFRCSSLGKIMTDPRGKSPWEKWSEAHTMLTKVRAEYDELANKETKSAQKKAARIEKLEALVSDLYKSRDTIHLSETCIEELIKIYLHVTKGRDREITNKYIEKGLEVEEDSLTLISRVHEKFYKKNEERRTNDYITGEPDVTTPILWDAKSCWDAPSFYKHKTKELPDDYFFQMQGYCELWDREEGIVCFALIDTPMALINQEKERLLYKMGVVSRENELYIAAAEDLEKQLTFSDFSLKQRVYEVKVKRDPELMQMVYERIKVCRQWLNEFAKADNLELIEA